MATVFERVQRIVVDLLGFSEAQVQHETSFEELGVDSLDLIEIVIRFEEEFAGEGAGSGQEFEITDDQLKKIATVGDAVSYLKSRGIRDE